MTPAPVPDGSDPLESLPRDARARLVGFMTALERINVGDLTLYAVRQRETEHSRAVAAAAQAASERHLEPQLEAARAAAIDYVTLAYQNAMMRISYVGPTTATGFGPADDRVRVMRSLADAVTAIILDDALDDAVRAELMGAWDGLLIE
jgi:hypothetical protein